MPPSPSSPSGRPGRPARATPAMVAGLGAVGLVVLAVLLFLLVRVLSESGASELGDPTFDVNASVLAAQIERDGPVLFPDLLGRGRDIYVHHLSSDRREGWRAFRATAGAAGRRCTLRWERAEGHFSDPCEPGRTYPADGTGLEQYAARVEGPNKLVVDLRRTAP